MTLRITSSCPCLYADCGKGGAAQASGAAGRGTGCGTGGAAPPTAAPLVQVGHAAGAGRTHSGGAGQPPAAACRVGGKRRRTGGKRRRLCTASRSAAILHLWVVLWVVCCTDCKVTVLSSSRILHWGGSDNREVQSSRSARVDYGRRRRIGKGKTFPRSLINCGIGPVLHLFACVSTRE